MFAHLIKWVNNKSIEGMNEWMNIYQYKIKNNL